jgi:hypothetical protein
MKNLYKFINCIEKYGKRIHNGCCVAEFEFGLKTYCINYNESLEPYRIKEV